MRKDQRDGSTDPQIIYHRNLSTEHTEDTDFLSTEGRIFLVATLEIFEEIFLKNGRGPEIILLPMNQNL